jgi:hypothetical protein
MKLVGVCIKCGSAFHTLRGFKNHIKKCNKNKTTTNSSQLKKENKNENRS